MRCAVLADAVCVGHGHLFLQALEAKNNSNNKNKGKRKNKKKNNNQQVATRSKLETKSCLAKRIQNLRAERHIEGCKEKTYKQSTEERHENHTTKTGLQH